MLFYIKPFYQQWWGNRVYLVDRFSRSRESVWVWDIATGRICIPVTVGTIRKVRY